MEKLAKALAAFQGEVTSIVKNKENPYFKSKYADLSGLWDVIREPLTKHGLSVVQFPVSGEQGIGVVTYLLHESGQSLSGEFYMPPVKKDPQAAGSCITYARRYALGACLGLTADEDDDGNAATHTTKKGNGGSTEAYNNSDAHWMTLRAHIIKAGVKEKDLAELVREAAAVDKPKINNLGGFVTSFLENLPS